MRTDGRADRRVAGCRAWAAGLMVTVLASAGACSEPARDTTPPKGSSDATAAVGSAESGRPLEIVAVGDIACEADEPVTPTECQHAATARLATSLKPDAVIALGDLQYDTGAEGDFEESYARSWGALKHITRPVPGNHEYKTEDAAGYFGYLDDPASWYAWNAGAWRIYMLNSNCSEIDCAAQREWLLSELRDDPRECTAIAAHFPRFSSGKHGSAQLMSRFWAPAFANNVDLALAGHDHHYERFAPMDADGEVQPGRGITSFVVGTGGKSLYAQGDVVDGSEYFQNTAFGVLRLTLSADAFSWQFLDTDNAVLDEGSAPCV